MIQPDSNTLLLSLRAEEQAFRDFGSTLQAEQQALISGDVAALTAITATKFTQVEQLNKLAAERLQRLAAQGYASDREGMETWAAQAGTAMLDAWRSMLAAAEEAHHANQVNGALIQDRIRHNKQMMSVLLAASNQVNLYGPDGQRESTLPGGTSRGIIGKA